MRKLKYAVILLFANIGLFIIGLIIVYMFLKHSLLYRLGLPLLVVVGAFMVFVTIRLIMFFTTLGPDVEKSTGEIVFTEEERGLILTGRKVQKIFPRPRSDLKKGMIVDAKTKVTDGKPFARLRIKRTYAKPSGDLTREEALKEGFETRKAFEKVFISENDDNIEVSVVVFRLEE